MMNHPKAGTRVLAMLLCVIMTLSLFTPAATAYAESAQSVSQEQTGISETDAPEAVSQELPAPAEETALEAVSQELSAPVEEAVPEAVSQELPASAEEQQESVPSFRELRAEGMLWDGTAFTVVLSGLFRDGT